MLLIYVGISLVTGVTVVLVGIYLKSPETN